MTERKNIPEDGIHLHKLGRAFQRGETAVRALRDVDLTILPGEFIALVGPSGSGKSTLLNLLGGLDRASDGELWLADLPLHQAVEKDRTRHRREQVGFIFQNFNLLPRLTALENVAVPLMLAGVPKEARQARAAELLTLVGLGHRMDHYPAEMSGGEQQRTAVARALVHRPRLILADEPTGNLDSKTGNEVMALLQKLNAEQGITLVVVTHDEEVAAYANRIVRLRDGAVEAITTIRSLDLHSNGAPASVTPPPTGNRPGLKMGDFFAVAWRNLGRRPVRNFLTAGGVLIGIITLVTMVSFGVGLQREIQRNFDTIGLETIFVNPIMAEADEFDPFARSEPVVPLTPAMVDTIAALPGVNGVTPSLELPFGMDIALADGDTVLPVRVTFDAAAGRFGPPGLENIVAGTDYEDRQTGIVMVRGLADQLLGPGEAYEDLIGREVSLVAQLPRGETNTFASEIIGITGSPGQRSIDLGLADRTAIKAWWFDQPDILETEGYDSVVVQAADLGAVPAVIASLRDMQLQPQSLEAVLDVANQVLALVQALLGSVGGLALLVAALGVANTMMMAIYERTREIGVLKALGASAREIRWLFTVEAALIGLIGGVAGLIMGTILGRIIDWIGHQYLISEGVTGVGQLSVIPPWLAFGAVGFAALIGIVAGLYPAARAARLDPVTALRHE